MSDEETRVPIEHICGHRRVYRWDAWEVRLGATPHKELCPDCRQANLDDLSPPPRIEVDDDGGGGM